MKYLVILLLLTGCAEVQTKFDSMKYKYDDRLICKSENMILCSGWRTE